MRFRALEEDYWRKKLGLKWFKDKDRNASFFHSMVKSKRKMLHIYEIIDGVGNILKMQSQIGNATVSFYMDQFTDAEVTDWLELMDNIPSTITPEENNQTAADPTIQEIQAIINSMCGDNASRSDGFSGLFFQKRWGIIGEDATRVIKAFFCGHTLPRFITHTNLVLLPKKKSVKDFSDMRPISLCNFINKIISRLIHVRLSLVIPRLVSLNQMGFVKGKSITKNMLLVQEIIRDIWIRKKWHNVVVKLDMAKAYDRVLWVFLTKVLRKFGFSEVIIDMI